MLLLSILRCIWLFFIMSIFCFFVSFVVVDMAEWEKCGVGSQCTCNHFFVLLYFDVLRQRRVLFNSFATKQCLGMLKMRG